MNKKILKTCLAVVPCLCAGTLLTACDGEEVIKEVQTSIPEVHVHSYSGEWESDNFSHWHVSDCEHEGRISDKLAHEFGDDDTCDICAFTRSKLQFSLLSDGSGYEVVGIGQETSTDITIPSVYNGKVVKSIGLQAFNNNTTLTSVVISEGVEKISKDAFVSCSNLLRVNFPTTLKEIGDQAFALCEKLDHVNIPYGVSSISHAAFYGCTALKEATLPNSVTHIDDFAFGATGIEYLIMPDSVLTLGEGAFAGCPKLDYVKLSNSLTNIPRELFAESGNGGMEIEIPASVRVIESFAFFNTTKNCISIPEGVEIIEDYAFYGAKINQVTLPKSLKSIGRDVFGFDDMDGGIDEGIKEIYYLGSPSDWEKIDIDNENPKLNDGTISIYYYSETEPSYTDGYTYWHIVEGFGGTEWYDTIWVKK